MSTPLLTFWLLVTSTVIYFIYEGRSSMLCILAPLVSQTQRVKIINDLLPSWDSNQTWFVYTIAGLYAGFPDFFGRIMTQHYISMIALLIFLMLRGACIEFYMKSKTNRIMWLRILAVTAAAILSILATIISKLFPVHENSLLATLAITFFWLWFHGTQAFCFLFSVSRIQRLLIILGLLITSCWVAKVHLLTFSDSTLSISILTLRIGLLIYCLFITWFSTPSLLLGRALLWLLFGSQAYYLILLYTNHFSFMVDYSNSDTYFIINLSSLLFLPVIFIGLLKLKQLFKNQGRELAY